MRQVVREGFCTFTDRFEGKLAFMYLDVLGLVTTGRGNLIDSPGAAQALPWKQAYTGGHFGALATPQQVTEEWKRVKSYTQMAKQGGGAFAKMTVLRLAPSDIDDLTFSKLDEMWVHLLGRFPDLESWPAAAQLGLVSMAWAMGPAFNFPLFAAGARAQNWLMCEAQCHIGTAGNPGVVPRNAANVALFAYAYDTSNDLDSLPDVATVGK